MRCVCVFRFFAVMMAVQGVSVSVCAKTPKDNRLVFFSSAQNGVNEDFEQRVEATVRSRIKKWQIAVDRQADHLFNREKAAKGPDFELACATTNALGCFWYGETDSGLTLHLVLFSAQSTWRLDRQLETTDEGAIADASAMIIFQMLDAILVMKKNSPALLSQTRWSVADDEQVLKKRRRHRRYVADTPPWPLSLGIGYHLTVAAARIEPFQGVGFSATMRPWPGLLFFVSYVATAPAIKKDPEMSLELTPHPAKIGIHGAFLRGGVKLVLLAALGLNVLKVVSTPQIDVFSDAKQNYLFHQWSLMSGVQVQFRFSRWLALYVEGDADFYLNRPSYDIAYRDGNRKLLSQWPVAGIFQLGFVLERHKKE